ncbi:MAG: fucose-binding lectin II [Flammeovirgaceae bacterium]
MPVLRNQFTGSFPFEIPANRKAIFMFTVQSAAKEVITFTKYPTKGDQQQGTNGKEYKQASGQGTNLTGYEDAVLDGGYYTCSITANGNPNVKILQDTWTVDVEGKAMMTVIGAAVEDWTDNDYNDVFLQISWWTYQG